ncbi:MAG TPA: nucleotidyltransferase [Candidatus Atribacteria bacterium]|nr:nucleotidyltransferase [Candidatus Atribacteria bacterium]
MANVQKQFIDFHETIKLDNENETLREKREIVLNKLKKKISPDAPPYEWFGQGSYSMSTGIKPLTGEYDIDVGLFFDMPKENTEPVSAKQWVFDALNGHTESVIIKTPCVTVTYKENGQPSFHVDLTVYAAKNADGKIYLAKGRPNSALENKFWEPSDPKELIRLVNTHFDEADDRAQFRRVIRYLKRWKDEKFQSGGHSAPTGIALTVSAMSYMRPIYLVDSFTNKRKYDDLSALKTFIKNLLNAFKLIIRIDGSQVERLEVRVPTPNYDDLFAKMTDNQITTFKNKLENLLDALEEAEAEVDPVEACEILQKQFGNDFRVPPKDETAKQKSVAVTTGSSSA